MGSAGNLRGLTAGNKTVMEKGEGLATASTRFGRVPTCGVQGVAVPTSFARLQSQDGGTD